MRPQALQLLLQALVRRAVRVEEVVGLTQPVLAPAQLLLPCVPDLGRAAAAHAAAHLLHSRAGQDARGRKPLVLAVLSAVEDARVERLLCASLPGIRRWFRPFQPAAAPEGLGFAPLMARLDRVLADVRARDGHHWVQHAQQGFWDLPADAAPAMFAQLGLVLANMLGQMRVPFDTLYRPQAAYRDDHSYLWNHGCSADEAPLPADGGAPAAAPAAPAATATVLRERHYGEWHEKLGLWRPGWCRVQERAPARSGPARAPHRRRPPPQADGETLDLQAAVAALVDRRRGHSWEPRLFRRQAPPARASVLLLLDLSQSTRDAWGAGPLTVQGLQQQTALWLARELSARGARVAVHGFASNGRAEVAYWRAVDFGVPCDPAALAALPVQHSTRLGAALRHAHVLLAGEAATHRSLVLLSDGQPWDIDVFEADHLLHDARRAAEDLRAAGVRVRCIRIGARKSTALHTVFGVDGLHPIDSAPVPGRLAGVWRAVLGRLV